MAVYVATTNVLATSTVVHLIRAAGGGGGGQLGHLPWVLGASNIVKKIKIL